jgi:hypothetical protein
MELTEERRIIQRQYDIGLKGGLPADEIKKYRALLDEIDLKLVGAEKPPEVPEKYVVIKIFGIPVYSKKVAVDEDAFYARMEYRFEQAYALEAKKRGIG